MNSSSAATTRRFLAVRSTVRTLTLGLLCASALAGPSGTRAAEAVPGYVVLPIVPMGKGNQATVRVTVNDQSTMLMLDTGASSIALDRRFYNAARAHAPAGSTPPSEVGRKIKANGEVPAEVGFIDSLKANGTDLGKYEVAVLDLSSLWDRYNRSHGPGSVTGLLGEDVLRRYNAIIDWARRGVYLNTNPAHRMKLGGGLIAAGWTAVPMSSTEARHFTVEATVDGQPVQLIVDTGATFTTIDGNAVKLGHMVYHGEASTGSHIGAMSGTSRMINGDAAVYVARLEHWKIGGYQIESSTIAVNKTPRALLQEKSSGNGPVVGLLGAEVLASNNAIIDIAGSTLYLKPPAKR